MQLLKNSAMFYGTQGFITMFTRAIHWIQLNPATTTQFWLRSVLILATHLCLGHPSRLILLVFATKSSMHCSSLPFMLHALTLSSSPNIFRVIKSWRLWWAAHSACMWGSSAESWSKRSTCGWEDSIDISYCQVGCEVYLLDFSEKGVPLTAVHAILS
jgi:hypothetical protein